MKANNDNDDYKPSPPGFKPVKHFIQTTFIYRDETGNYNILIFILRFGKGI